MHLHQKSLIDMEQFGILNTWCHRKENGDVRVGQGNWQSAALSGQKGYVLFYI